MYKVTYFILNRVTFRWFDTLSEATDFSLTVPTGDVLEIKLYKDQVKKEDRT